MSFSVSGATIEDNIEIVDAEQPHSHDEADVDGIETNGEAKDRLYTTPTGDIKVKPLPYKIPRTKRLVLNYICNIEIFYNILQTQDGYKAPECTRYRPEPLTNKFTQVCT